MKVIFVVGAGRSGSTVLNAVLGMASDTVAVGELANLPNAGWIKAEYCACGQRVNVCSFWTEVRECFEQLTGSTPQHAASAIKSVEKFRFLYRALLFVNSSNLMEYGALSAALYRCIGKVSGRSTIVDASKNPGLAIALARRGGVDLRIVHLVRDVRGVAWSLKKSYARNDAAGLQRDIPGRAFLRSAAFWGLANILSETAMSRVAAGKRVRVRYEELVANPRETLLRISSVTGIDVGPAIDFVETGKAVPFGHTVAGNRVRMGGEVTLKADFEWQSAMPARTRRWLRWLCWPLMRRYGYF